MALVATACFAKILLQMQHREPYLAALAFAFVPMVYIASVSAMDYIWALAFVLLALLGALAQRATLSGVALGLAVGTRITSALFLLPLAITLYERNRWGTALTRIATLAATAGIISALAFYPLYRRYGWGFLSYVEAQERLLVAVAQATVGLFGTVGTAAIVFSLMGFVLSVLLRRAPAADMRVLPLPLSPSSVQLVGSGGAGHPCVSSAPCRSGISATACTAGADRIVCTPDAGAVSLALCLAHRFTICVGHSVSADGDHSSTNGCCRILPCAKSRRASVDLARSAAGSAPVGLPETSTDGRAHAVCS